MVRNFEDYIKYNIGSLDHIERGFRRIVEEWDSIHMSLTPYIGVFYTAEQWYQWYWLIRRFERLIGLIERLEKVSGNEVP